MLSRRQFLKLSAAAGAGLFVPWQLNANGQWNGSALASVQTPQTPLDPMSIPKYVDALPVFGPASGGAAPRVAKSSITVTTKEIQQQVLPASMYPSQFSAGTWVWAYQVDSRPAHYPGFSIEALRGIPTTVKYVNGLPLSPVLWQYITVDQTLHWANPLGLDMMDPARMMPYAGPPPTVAHLHGGEVPSNFDGGPEQWFTPDGRHGRAYKTLYSAGGNAAVYLYPNMQEATTLWFHDHTLGATRLNVYAGLAAFYLLRDAFDTGIPGKGLNLPAGAQEIEIAMQDRQFDTNGQWFYPDGSLDAGLNGPPPNPDVHPFWNPEFFGDVIVVNGKSWPYLNVEPRRYRFRFVGGSNARFYKLTIDGGLPFYQIGTDGGLLDKPVRMDELFMAPGERADVIVDFGSMAGQTLIMRNTANAPYPDGDAPDPDTTGQILQFRVGTTVTNGPDKSFNPAAAGAVLRGAFAKPPKIVRLANPTAGTVAAGVTVAKKRQLTLKEVATDNGPLEVLVNNTKWTGVREGTMPEQPIPGYTSDGYGNWLSELPKVGSTEVWEIINLTMDAHPIHLHLVQFQLVSRQAFTDDYRAVWEGAFPGGTFDGVTYQPGEFIPGFGPPRDYFTPNEDQALGGNPGVNNYLTGPVMPPDPNEAGWKDTVKMFPGEVTRIVVRWAPQGIPVSLAKSGVNLYPFDPTTGPGYVWHCHIVDHEDNEMMRPYRPVK